MDPVTREEMYLAYMAGDTSVPLPEPVTRLEKFWHNVAMNGGGGGGSAGVSSFNGRTGEVKPAAGDYDAAMVGADPAGSAASAESAANAYTDAQIAAAKAAIPTQTSQLTNDSGFVGASDVNAAMTAANSYTDTQIAAVTEQLSEVEQTAQESHDLVFGAYRGGTETVYLDISEVRSYLNALPRLLVKGYNIYVSGTLDADQVIDIHHFYGYGSIHIMAETFGDCVVKGQIEIRSSTIPVQVSDILFEFPAETTLTYRTPLLVYHNAGHVRINSCEFAGPGKEVSNMNAITMQYGCSVEINYPTVHDFYRGILCQDCSYASILGGTFSNNNVGSHLRTSSLLLSASTPKDLGGITNYSDGGLLVGGKETETV